MQRKQLFLFLALAGLLLSLGAYHWSAAKTPDAAPVAAEKGGGPQWPSDLFFLQRAGPEGKFSLERYVEGLAQARAMAAEKGDWAGFDLDWNVRGPRNLGGRVNTIAVDPQNDDVILVGFSLGGVWRTDDGGENWYPIFDDQPFSAIGHIAFDPTNSNVIYVGTGDPNISGYPAIGDGLYRSADGGLTWTRLGPTSLGIISKVYVHPEDPQTLLAGSMGLPFAPSDQRGLYRSADGGQTWTQTLFVSNQAGIIDLVAHPDNPDVIFAASWDRIRSNQQSFVSGPNARIYRSDDAGLTWTMLTQGLPTTGDMGRIGLCIAPGNPNHLYALYVGTDSQVHDIYESLNGGQSWASVLAPNSASPLEDGVLGGFGWYFGQIRVSPDDENDIWLLGVDLWRSRDGGVNWEEGAPPWFVYDVHADKHDLVFNSQGHLLLGTDGGLSRSLDDAENWENAEDIPTNQVYRVAFDTYRPEQVFGGMQDNGSSGGASLDEDWPRIFGGDGFQMAFRPDQFGAFYAETQNGGIVGTDSDGDNWFGATDGIDPSDRVNWDAPYFISTHNPDVLYTGTYRVYRSDAGVYPVFGAVSDDITDGNIFGPRYHTISTLHESPVVEGLLYAGTTDGNVWRGEEGGLGGWTPIFSGLPDRYVTSVKASPDDVQRVYVCLSGYRAGDFQPHLYRSDNQGANWVNIAGDLPNLSINDVWIIPGHQDSILFAATDGGVYGSKNGGENWERLGANMTFIPVYDLEWNPETNELIAATFGRSIQTYPLDSLLAAEPPVAATDPAALPIGKWSIAPNPANHTAWLSWAGWQETGAPLQLEIYDLKGRRLHQQTLRGAEGRLPIACSAWPAGVYYASLRSGRKVAGQKWLISR